MVHSIFLSVIDHLHILIEAMYIQIVITCFHLIVCLLLLISFTFKKIYIYIYIAIVFECSGKWPGPSNAPNVLIRTAVVCNL